MVSRGEEQRSRGGMGRWLASHPVVLILLLAPFFGEGLSGSSPPLVLVVPWHLAFMVALYGCGALVCREVAVRAGLGFPGLCLLGVAYAVWEEALVDRYWFFPDFWADSGVGTYSVVWHTNVLLAVHLSVFHAAVSICCSVLVVEWLAPRFRARAWVSRRSLVVAALALALTPVFYGEFDQRPPGPVLVAAGALLLAVAGLAVVVGRRFPPPAPETPPSRAPRRGLAVVAFVCVLAHWVAVYTLPTTELPWPLGVAVALVPVAVGIVVVRAMATTGPYGVDGVRVVVGLLSFFVALGLLVGLLGRYDMIASALITGWALRRLYRNRTQRAALPVMS